MKYLIISDIHLRWRIANSIIKKERNKYDKILFLGDYFDNFGALPRDYIDISKWLKDNLYNENYIFLLGNHDAAYLSYYNCILGERHYYRCSGFSEQWFDIIHKHLTIDDWKNMKLHYFIKDNVLCSHAGLSYNLYNNKDINLKEYIESESECGFNRILQNFAPIEIIQVGKSRGGLKPCGGITWCDYNDDFVPVPKLNQIFGHTPIDEPQLIYEDNIFNLALDTHNNHYALYDDKLNSIMIKIFRL